MGYDPDATRVLEFGDVDQAFEEADIVREFTYYFGGARPIPLQPASCVAKWDGDRLTFWGMGQGIFQYRRDLSRGLGIDESNIRFINKWNGGTFGPDTGSGRFQVWIAYIAKMTGRPTKISLPKDQELGQISVKPETLTRFKVGANRDGKIIASERTFYMSRGSSGGGGGGAGGGRSELYLHVVPNWRENWLQLHDEYPADWRLEEQRAAGIQVRLGKHDGRNGRSGRNGSRSRSGWSTSKSPARRSHTVRAVPQSVRCLKA